MDRRQFLGGSALSIAAFKLFPAMAAGETLATLSDGSFSVPIAMLSSSAEPARLRAALEGAGLSSTQHRNPMNVTILKRGDDVILFDCGAGPNFMEGAGLLAKSLEAAGVASETVTHVLFTHAHPDHLWGALDDFGAPAFPQATYHMASAERDFWMAPDVFSKLPEDRQAFAAGAKRNLKELESVLKTFRPGEEVLPGIATFETGGHTPGHVSFEVRQGSQSTMVLGDALTHAVISFQHPEWAGGFDQEPDRAIATRKRLLDRMSSEHVRIVGYHLPAGGVGRVERKDAAYRFVNEA